MNENDNADPVNWVHDIPVDPSAAANSSLGLMVETLTELHRGLPHVMFSVKDLESRYIAVNQAFADRAGCRSPADVVGRTACDLFPSDLAAAYEEQDQRVVATARPLTGQLEMITRPDRSVGWYVTTKAPVATPESAVAAVAAVSVDVRAGLEDARAQLGRLDGLGTALTLVQEQFREPLRVDDMARAAGLSAQQLERRMRRVLGITAKQYVLRVRLDEAVRLLREGDIPLPEVANRCGFYDQAAFTRAFSRATGTTPGRFRARVPRPGRQSSGGAGRMT